jgi:hypothetical protein
MSIGILMRRPEGKRKLGRHGHMWEDNIKMILVGWDRMAWTCLILLSIRTSGGLL